MHKRCKKKQAGFIASTVSTALLLHLALAGRAGAQQSSGSQSTVYYDADEIDLDKDTGNIKAKGNAFILLGNVFVSADNLEFNKTTQIMMAEGGVRVVRNRERISASRVLINEKLNEVRMDDVEIYADPKDTDARVNEEVLGFSKAELAFEVARQERIREILQELQNLRVQFLNLKAASETDAMQESVRIRKRYSQLLARLVRTKYQPSDVLRDLPEDARKRIENRREAVRTFATKDPELAKKLAGLQRVPGYLSMKAHRVFQHSNQIMDVEKASLTTCRCDPDDHAAWGLSASRALVEPNEYITLYGTTLEVADFPLVYSPWFKFPIKTRRQSGFLLPSFYLSRAGDAASFPYYLTLGEHADSTWTFTYFSKRGPRAETEMRYSLSEESRTTLRGEFLREKRSPDSGNIQEGANRWAWNAQTNLPIARRTSFKVDFEKMSDQRYFSDLTKEPGTTQDLFTPQIIVRRFPQRSGALEHSGESFSLGVRLQQPDDVFAENQATVPSRMPRVDFTIFPRTFSETTALSWEAAAAYERILENEATGIAGPRNGERNSSRARLNYPIPLNQYFNLRIAAELARIAYNTSAYSGELSYALADLSTDIPLYANLLNLRKADQSETTLRHNLTPFAQIKWIPEVLRSNNYPHIYSTFYAADNIARSQILEFGFNTDLQVVKDEFIVADRGDSQQGVHGHNPAPPADEKQFLALLKVATPPTAQEVGQFLFNMTSQSKDNATFDQWADAELKTFVSETRDAENHRAARLLAILPKSYRRTETLNVRPAALALRAAYNFDAIRTAREQNRDLQPGQTPASAVEWGEISGNLSLAMQPFAPISASFLRVWQPAWKLYKEQNNSLGFTSSYGLSASFVRSTVTSEVVETSDNKSYPVEQLWGVDSGYQPKSWLKFQFQYRKNIKPQPAATAELEYSSLQKITLLGVQDCVDVTLQRFKDRDVRERMATWTLGLNLSFLGQQRQIESLGKVVDKAMKSQLNSKR